MNKKCFGNNGKNGCRILAVKGCPGDGCSFFKTESQHRADKQKAYRRLAALDKLEQRHIAEKYYGGKMPWLEGGGGYDC